MVNVRRITHITVTQNSLEIRIGLIMDSKKHLSLFYEKWSSKFWITWCRYIIQILSKSCSEIIFKN